MSGVSKSAKCLHNVYTDEFLNLVYGDRNFQLVSVKIIGGDSNERNKLALGYTASILDEAYLNKLFFRTVFQLGKGKILVGQARGWCCRISF